MKRPASLVQSMRKLGGDEHPADGVPRHFPSPGLGSGWTRWRSRRLRPPEDLLQGPVQHSPQHYCSDQIKEVAQQTQHNSL